MLTYAHARAASPDPPRRRPLPPRRRGGARAQDLRRGRNPRRDRPGAAGRPRAEAARRGGAARGGADSGARDDRGAQGRDSRCSRLVIVLDTTVLAYAVGTEHPLRDPCRRMVAAILDGSITATTTIDVIQEFAHGYARRRPRAV